jgi:hypothetical protein
VKKQGPRHTPLVARADGTPPRPVLHAGPARTRSPPPPADAGAALPRHVATASSDGVVKVWDCRQLGSHAGADAGGCRELASVDTRGRITCMALSAPGRKAPALAGGSAEAAGGGGAAAAEGGGKQKAKAAGAQQQQAQKQQQQQQQKQKGTADGGKRQLEESPQRNGQPQPQQAGKKAKPKQQQAKKPRPQQYQPSGGGADEALVPRVRTIIKKKKTRPEGGAGGGGGGVRIVNRKAPRQAR